MAAGLTLLLASTTAEADAVFSCSDGSTMRVVESTSDMEIADAEGNTLKVLANGGMSDRSAWWTAEDGKRVPAGCDSAPCAYVGQHFPGETLAWHMPVSGVKFLCRPIR